MHPINLLFLGSRLNSVSQAGYEDKYNTDEEDRKTEKPKNHAEAPSKKSFSRSGVVSIRGMRPDWFYNYKKPVGNNDKKNNDNLS
jgi:hypothetical protein